MEVRLAQLRTVYSLGTSGTNSPESMRSWKCLITAASPEDRDRQRLASGHYELDHGGAITLRPVERDPVLAVHHERACPSPPPTPASPFRPAA